MNPRFIQIACHAQGYNELPTIFALDEHGGVWHIDPEDENDKWHPITPIRADRA